MDASLAARLFFPVLLLAPGPLLGDGGELVVRPILGGEAAFFDYQRDGLKTLAGTRQPSSGMGRFGVALGYGLMNDLELGLGASLGLTGSQVLRSVELEGFSGDLYVDVLDVSVPVTLGYQLNFGHEVSASVQAQVGVAYLGWNELALVDPGRPDSAGNFARLPVATVRKDLVGFVAGAAVWVDWRPLDWFSLSLGPYGALRMAGETRVISAGVCLQPAFAFGVGPSI
ncbi:MAG: hypothetical protein ABIJ09_12200 [Pseudomonadota bacterium]